jgi:Flp pilus assembly protein TadD
LIPAANSITLLRVFHDDLPADESDDPTNQDKSLKKESGFKKVVAAPVRLFARLFGGKDEKKKQEMIVAKPTAKDLERFAAVPASGPKDESQPAATTPTAAADDPTAVTATAAERAAAAWFDQAIELQERGRADAAIEKLNAALSLRPNYAEARNLLGVCFDEKALYQKAQEEYKKAIKLESSNARFLNNLGYSYYLSGEYKDAIKWYQKALKFTPDDRRLHNNLGLAYGRRGDYNRAFQHFTQAVGEAGAHLNLGYVYNQQGRYEDAIRHYEIALRAQPKSLPALSNLAQLYERVGRLREAAELKEQHKKLQQTVDHK